MKTCNNPSHVCPRCRHHVRATTTPRPMASVLRTIAALAMITGLSGAAWYLLTTTLDQMTANDCRAGIQRACEALPR